MRHDHRAERGICAEGVWLLTSPGLASALVPAHLAALAEPADRWDAPAEPVAFEEFTRPWRWVARREVARRLGDRWTAGVAVAARHGLERLLASRLSDALSLVLFSEFTAFRASHSTPWDRLLAAATGGTERRLYDAFVAASADGGLAEVLRHYPVLEELVTELTRQWVDATVELVERLDHDRADLSATFGAGGPLDRVCQVETGLSDPHHGGRSVTILTFDSGVRVVYKPKDLGTESAFGRLLAWLDATGEVPLALRAPTVLVRDGYGWAEYLDRRPCADDAALGRYYYRAGMLACLVYALAGFDCHRENLLAHGEYPVLLDVECLFGHRVVMPDAASVHQMALDELRAGVLGTGLLPSWQVDEDDNKSNARDISGLHVPLPEELLEHARRWEHINTDAMALRVGPIRFEASQHVPFVDGREPGQALVAHADELTEGFASCYRALLRHRDELLAPDGPLAAFGGHPVRFLFRNTRVYGSLLHQLVHPEFLRDQDARSIELARLTDILTAQGVLGGWGPLIDTEVTAIERGDVPHFTALPSSDVLLLDDGSPLAGVLQEPSLQLVTERIAGLDEIDLGQQLGFIAGSLHSESARQDAPSPTSPKTSSSPAAPAGSDVSLVAAAEAIARDVVELAVRGDGSATWIAPQYLPRLDRYQLQPVGYDLHSGSCGPALFLAAVAATTGDRACAATARAALRPVRKALDGSQEDIRRGLRSGAATGIGSVVYTLTRCAGLLQDDELLASAASAVACINDQYVASSELDVFAGVAGDILGLLALHRATGDADVLERARWCGDRLLDTARPVATGGLAWPTLGGRILTGFSHGAAGIGYALARLGEATGTTGYVDAALAGVRYEDAVFDPEAGNWPDFRDDEQPAFKVNWCHGAPGIGLARLATWRSLAGTDAAADSLLLDDVERAVHTTLAEDLEGADHLCCGNLGRAELLLSAGAALGRDDLLAEVRLRAEAVVARAASRGGYQLHSSLPNRVHMPGFFMGVSGVGYALLRTAHPELLPAVLAWD